MAVSIHVISILIALGASFAIFYNSKGTRFHKIFGWIFVAGMGISVIASFWLPKFGHLSFIHILSVATLYWLIRGVWAIRHRQRKNNLYFHAFNMGKAHIAIWIAGIGVFVRHYLFPGRSDYGGVASVLVAIFIVPILLNLTKQYKYPWAGEKNKKVKG